MTIRLPEKIEERLKEEATRQGIAPDEYATKLIAENLPPASAPKSKKRSSLQELFAKWDAEDYTEDPEEIARRERDFEELMQALNRNRTEMEGPGARKLIP